MRTYISIHPDPCWLMSSIHLHTFSKLLDTFDGEKMFWLPIASLEPPFPSTTCFHPTCTPNWLLFTCACDCERTSFVDTVQTEIISYDDPLSIFTSSSSQKTPTARSWQPCIHNSCSTCVVSDIWLRWEGTKNSDNGFHLCLYLVVLTLRVVSVCLYVVYVHT